MCVCVNPATSISVFCQYYVCHEPAVDRILFFSLKDSFSSVKILYGTFISHVIMYSQDKMSLI